MVTITRLLFAYILSRHNYHQYSSTFDSGTRELRKHETCLVGTNEECWAENLICPLIRRSITPHDKWCNTPSVPDQCGETRFGQLIQSNGETTFAAVLPFLG